MYASFTEIAFNNPRVTLLDNNGNDYWSCILSNSHNTKASIMKYFPIDDTRDMIIISFTSNMQWPTFIRIVSASNNPY